MYRVFGDYGSSTETLLAEFTTLEQAIELCQDFTESGDFEAYTDITVVHIAGDEIVVDEVYYAEDFEDLTV